MTLGIVSLPVEYFPDPNKGRPIFNGQIFVGEPDLDPEILANRKAIVARQEDGTDIPISPAQQPVRIGSGGVPVYNGATVQILVEGNYSIKVLNKQGVQEYYWPNYNQGLPIVVGDDHNLLGNRDAIGAHDNIYNRQFDTLDDAISAVIPIDSVGSSIEVKERSLGNRGGAIWDVVLLSSVTVSPGAPNIGNIVASTGSPTLALSLRINLEVNIDQMGAIADFDYNTLTGTNNMDAIQATIDAIGGANDITSAFIYEPTIAKIIIPQGVYGVSPSSTVRLLINKNNVSIVGEGTFNSTIINFGPISQSEMIRFKEAYGCEISNLTLDGGLPFSPDGTETNGVDTPLVLDQVANFISKDLNIANYRIRGIQAIHLWESNFKNLRIFNGGFFGTGATPSAGIAFDDRNQESTFFPGSESNQVKFSKVAFGTVGTLVKATSPCFNISFDFVVAEGRTWPVDYQSLSESKWIISGISQGFVVHHAWSYHHDQPFNNNAILFELANAGQGCKFLGYRVYQEIPTGNGNFLEVPNIFANSSAFSVEVDLSIEDVGDAVTQLFESATSGSMITGLIDYRKGSLRTINNFMGPIGILQYSGDVIFIGGAFTGSTPELYRWKGKSQSVSQIDGAGVFDEFSVRAIANFDGRATGGPRMEKGISVTRTAEGQYLATFHDPMPDNTYSVNITITKLFLGDNAEIASQSNTGFTFAVRDTAGVNHDSDTIGISVFR